MLLLVFFSFALSIVPRIVESPTYIAEPTAELIPQVPIVEREAPEKESATATTVPPEEPEKLSQGEIVEKPRETDTPPPSALELLKAKTQSAVVNILCEPEAGGTMAVSGTGVMIDPRGVILTNAHVAQYVLLSSHDEINLSCIVRSGSPAKGGRRAKLLYIPPEWVAEHAADISKANPSGTGEHDYALVLATGSASDDPIGAFPYLPIQPKIGVEAVGSTVILSAYPAEYSGLASTKEFLLLSSVVTTIKNVLTFDENTIDVLSFGAVALAQGGSSGGAVVDEDGNLISIISTTSDKEFIAERDLRGVSLSYINRALEKSWGQNLMALLSGDVAAQGAQFRTNQAPALAQQIFNHIKQH